MLAVVADEPETAAYIARELVDLDELPEADDDPDLNFEYGRLAALEWATDKDGG